MNDKFEQLGVLIDELDNLAHGLNLPIPANIHVEALKSSLPEKVAKLKEIFIEIAGENPWE